MLKILYKIGAIIMLLVICSNFQTLKGQYKYSIDIETRKARKVPLKYALTQAKENRKIYVERKRNRRKAERDSKKVQKHTYSIQTRAVKKRMQESRKKAEYNNTGKLPLIVKLKNIING